MIDGHVDRVAGKGRPGGVRKGDVQRVVAGRGKHDGGVFRGVGAIFAEGNVAAGGAGPGVLQVRLAVVAIAEDA